MSAIGNGQYSTTHPIMQLQEDIAIQELTRKLEEHARRRLGSSPKVATLDSAAIAKTAQAFKKSVGKGAKKIEGWLIARIRKLGKSPRRLWPWSREQVELYEHLHQYALGCAKSDAQLPELLDLMLRQHRELTERLAALESRVQRCEKEYPGLITTLSAELNQLRKSVCRPSDSSMV